VTDLDAIYKRSYIITHPYGKAVSMITLQGYTILHGPCRTGSWRLTEIRKIIVHEVVRYSVMSIMRLIFV